jgi:acyl-CoA thioester hydrolase
MTMASQLPQTVDGGHVETVTVYYDDLDSMGIVHNSRYAVMLERALNAFWSRRGYTYANGVFSKPDVCLAVAEFSIMYRTPVRSVGDVNVHFWVDRLGDSSVVYAFRVVSTDGATVHADGRRVHIRLDEATMRPAPWTPPCRSIMETLRLD